MRLEKAGISSKLGWDSELGDTRSVSGGSEPWSEVSSRRKVLNRGGEGVFRALRE